MKGPRRKGAEFELSICRILSSWVTGDPKQLRAPVAQLAFRRRLITTTPSTGDWNSAGDLSCRVGVEWPFCTECKKAGRWEMDGVFDPAIKWPVWGWWAQARRQADVVQLFPMLVRFTRNAREIYVMLEASVFSYICDKSTQGCRYDIMGRNQEVKRCACGAVAGLGGNESHSAEKVVHRAVHQDVDAKAIIKCIAGLLPGTATKQARRASSARVLWEGMLQRDARRGCYAADRCG